jgi:hypothetical protein
MAGNWWIAALLVLSTAADAFLAPLIPRAVSALLSRNENKAEELNKLGCKNDDDVLYYVDFLLRADTTMNDAEILKRIDALHAADCEIAAKSPLVVEDNAMSTRKTSGSLPFDWIHVGDDNYPLAVQSVEPVLDAASTAAILHAAQDLWSTKSASSRFTYQYTGNSEAHVSDFLQHNTSVGNAAVDTINQALATKIYPLIREAFVGYDASRMFVYDALVIRYNATAAAKKVAGQPLHRDLGLVSVNIMLNDAFEGGGTFFENQLLPSSKSHGSVPKPIKPLGIGHCLAHAANERHAGAGTVSGVRDILVLFVTAVQSTKMRNARLKQCRTECEKGCTSKLGSLWCRIRHHRLAVAADPADGEAYQYLGTALMNYAEYVAQARDAAANADETETALQAAIACFRRAAVLTRCDARVYNNLGIALSRQQRLLDAEQAYQRGLELLVKSDQAGCNVEDDLDSISLNYGLDLANQDRFAEACEILARPAAKRKDGSSNSQIIENAYRLWEFCACNLETAAL